MAQRMPEVNWYGQRNALIRSMFWFIARQMMDLQRYIHIQDTNKSYRVQQMYFRKYQNVLTKQEKG